ncbi:hypothetical protein ABFY60_27920 [Lysinibacillus pakistanensis]|uniref:hypothetical protein n=1 Tax=Lysinibacillus pakistanensis TaxID=759811 RepID=UPI003D269D6D
MFFEKGENLFDMNKNFIKFNNLFCFKINVLSALIFIVLFGLSVIFIKKMDLQAQQAIELTDTDNAMGAFIFTVIISIFIGSIWFIYSIIIPLVIPLFTRFSDNIKSILSLLVCNFIIAFFLYKNFTVQLAFFYAVPVFISIFITLYWRYTLLLKKLNMVENDKRII